jgi:hypothetical protein
VLKFVMISGVETRIGTVGVTMPSATVSNACCRFGGDLKAVM